MLRIHAVVTATQNTQYPVDTSYACEPSKHTRIACRRCQKLLPATKRRRQGATTGYECETRFTCWRRRHPPTILPPPSSQHTHTKSVRRLQHLLNNLGNVFVCVNVCVLRAATCLAVLRTGANASASVCRNNPPGCYVDGCVIRWRRCECVPQHGGCTLAKGAWQKLLFDARLGHASAIKKRCQNPHKPPGRATHSRRERSHTRESKTHTLHNKHQAAGGQEQRDEMLPMRLMAVMMMLWGTLCTNAARFTTKYKDERPATELWRVANSKVGVLANKRHTLYVIWICIYGIWMCLCMHNPHTYYGHKSASSMGEVVCASNYSARRAFAPHIYIPTAAAAATAAAATLGRENAATDRNTAYYVLLCMLDETTGTAQQSKSIAPTCHACAWCESVYSQRAHSHTIYDTQTTTPTRLLSSALLLSCLQ